MQKLSPLQVSVCDNLEPVPSEQRSSGWKQHGGVQMSAWDSDSPCAECVLSHVQAELCLSVLGGLVPGPPWVRKPIHAHAPSIH